jgi:MEMO1 family protein
MSARQPCAAQFYYGDTRAQMETFMEGFTAPAEPSRVVAGIVPHAGWFFSGATAAHVFLTIKAKQTPSTFVLLGAVHVPGIRSNAVYPEGSWSTPLGELRVDSALATKLLDEHPNLVQPGARAHTFEHSIEVQTPMIKLLFPDAMILPIAVPPSDDAVELGEALGRLIKGTDAVVIGSTDLTHYGDNYGYTPAGYGKGAYDWMVENDEHILTLAERMMPQEILVEASVNHNSCGAGAMAATTAAAKVMGARKGVLIEHTTSYDVMPEGEFVMAVGYAGMVF